MENNKALIIRPFDVFYAIKNTEFGEKKHYYICIYTQKEDENNKLFNDIYALFVTTNQKYENFSNDYNVEIEINDVKSYVNCDKIVRLRIDERMELKQTRLSKEKRKEIQTMFEKFVSEIKRQMDW